MSAPRLADAHAERDPNVPRSFVLDGEGRVQRDVPLRLLAEAVRGGAGQLWVDVDSTNRHQVAVLEKLFRFHHLAIEDTLNPNSRAKVEEYDDYLFLVVRGVRFCEETEHDPYDLETYNLYFFLGPNYLVTVHGEWSESLRMVAERVERSPDMLGRGVERVMHAVMDASVDAYFPIIDQVNEFMDGLEERVFVSFDQEALRDIFAVKRLVLNLRRHLVPQREVFNILTNRPTKLLTHETQLYFRDVYDHVLRINDALDTFRDLLSSTLDSYLTQVSNRLGMVTKGLSVIATLSVPFVVVSGMWGMNFAHMPLSEHRFGFWIMLVLQLAVGVVLVAILRRKKLL